MSIFIIFHFYFILKDKAINMNIKNLFKYVKTIDFTNKNEIFYSTCDDPIMEYTFRFHQDGSIITNDIPKFTKVFPKRCAYDVTCISKKDCNHPQRSISTYKFMVDFDDIPFVHNIRAIIYILFLPLIFWLIWKGQI